MQHIYNCEFYCKKEEKLPYQKIFNGNIKQQIEVFKFLEENFEKRRKLTTEKQPPCDLVSDPLFSADNSNG